MKPFFRFISYVFIPLAMPLFALLIVFYTPTFIDFKTQINSLYFIEPSFKKFFLNAFSLFCWVFPVITLLVMKLSKQISSIELHHQKERFLPMVMTGAFLVMLLIMLYKFNEQLTLSKHLFALVYAGIIASLVYATINFFQKISLHAAGAGLLLGFLFAYYLNQSIAVVWPIYAACLLSGTIVAARMYLQKHSNKELLLGFSIGFVIAFVTDILLILYF